jgi:hypothetical protein
VLIEPGFLSKLHFNVLEIEGVVFNVLLFLRFCATEIKSIIKAFRTE